MTGWLVELVPLVAAVIFGAGGAILLLRITRRDVNGLGRNLRRTWACMLRLVALEIEDSVVRSKVLHIADLIDPK